MKADPSFTARSASGVWSRDVHIPEYYRSSGGYNPFPLDICLVGNMFRNEFLEVRSLKFVFSMRLAEPCDYRNAPISGLAESLLS